MCVRVFRRVSHNSEKNSVKNLPVLTAGFSILGNAILRWEAKTKYSFVTVQCCVFPLQVGFEPNPLHQQELDSTAAALRKG